MKIEFENCVSFCGSREEYEEIQQEATTLFRFITLFTQKNSSSEEGLRLGAINWLKELKHFDYGFGSNHMWITQKRQTRLLIIYFDKFPKYI